MGTYLQQLSDRVSIVASPRLWLEDAALHQLSITAALPGMRRVVGLPDLHPGRGYPVGAAFFSQGCFYPALVGNDIGCGMALWQTGVLASKVKLDKLDQRLGDLDHPLLDAERDVLDLHEDIERLRHVLAGAGLDPADLRALGTIGGGNHFAELQRIDAVDDHARVSGTGLAPACLQLLVHSGSRGLGQAVLRSHVDGFGHAGLEEGSAPARHYLVQHAAAVAFAELNRRVIAARILLRLRCEGIQVLDVNHNTVLPCRIDGVDGWLHRKGATPSNVGVVMLPGSRDAHSYLLEPIAAQGEVSLHSLAHGAGRKWQRSDCKSRLFKRATPDQLRRTGFGGRVICNDRSLIYEEAPQAYKPVESVLDCLVGAGLVRVLARSRPVLTYKTRGGEC
ncbi:MAG TPA: RNA ligase RtcB family protein [Telluria sp.]|nr:RNA ligase RtcB family protein [Telluria sp.]